MRHRLFKILLLLISSSMCFAIGEFVLRKYTVWVYQREVQGYQGTDFWLQIVDKPYFYVLNPTDGYRKRVVGDPKAPQSVWRDRINERHLRGDVVDISKLPAGTKRALFIGDSYTYGDAINEEHCFVRRLERLLSADGIPVACINAGVPGYNSEQEYEFLREIFDTYKPDLVVVSYVCNDAEPLMHVPRPPEYQYRYCASVLFEESKVIWNWLGWLAVRDRPLIEGRTPFVTEEPKKYYAHYALGAMGWRESRAALHAMSRLCNEKKVAFLVPVLPDFTSHFDARYPRFFVHDAVARWGKELDFEVLDLLPAVWGRDNSPLCVQGDGHPNSDGHEIMARALFPRCKALLSQ